MRVVLVSPQRSLIYHCNMTSSPAHLCLLLDMIAFALSNSVANEMRLWKTKIAPGTKCGLQSFDHVFLLLAIFSAHSGCDPLLSMYFDSRICYPWWLVHPIVQQDTNNCCISSELAAILTCPLCHLKEARRHGQHDETCRTSIVRQNYGGHENAVFAHSLHLHVKLNLT